MSRFDRAHTISYYRFVVYSWPYLVLFPTCGQMLVENRKFMYPVNAAVGILQKMCSIRIRNTIMMRLRCAEQSMMIS